MGSSNLQLFTWLRFLHLLVFRKIRNCIIYLVYQFIKRALWAVPLLPALLIVLCTPSIRPSKRSIGHLSKLSLNWWLLKVMENLHISALSRSIQKVRLKKLVSIGLSKSKNCIPKSSEHLSLKTKSHNRWLSQYSISVFYLFTCQIQNIAK